MKWSQKSISWVFWGIFLKRFVKWNNWAYATPSTDWLRALARVAWTFFLTILQNKKKLGGRYLPTLCTTSLSISPLCYGLNREEWGLGESNPGCCFSSSSLLFFRLSFLSSFFLPFRTIIYNPFFHLLFSSIPLLSLSLVFSQESSVFPEGTSTHTHTHTPKSGVTTFLSFSKNTKNQKKHSNTTGKI